MNKMSIKILAIVTACMGIMSCGNDKKEIKTNRFEEIVVCKQQSLTQEKNSPICKMDIRINNLANDDARARLVNDAIQQRLFDTTGLSMKQAVDSFIQQYTTNYVKDMTPLYREDRYDEKRKKWYEYSYTIQTKVETGLNDAIVYRIDSEVYEGGAHSIKQQQIINFNAENGKPIKLTDLFVKGYEYPLEDLLLEQLYRHTHAHSLDELHDKGYLLTMDIFIPKNFVLGEDGITFVYNPYEIAPYETGNTELTLSYSDLEKLLKKKS